MIFTSQSGLTDPGHSPAWDEWYLGHLAAMATVPGIGSAQRFLALDTGPPPSLAMYSIASPDVFQSAIYLSVRGMGPWQRLIDPQHYKRNLFDGLAVAPTIDPDSGAVLVVVDRDAPAPTEAGLTWLRAVGLDRSMACRGITVASDDAAARGLAATIGGTVALYRPVTRRYTGAA